MVTPKHQTANLCVLRIAASRKHDLRGAGTIRLLRACGSHSNLVVVRVALRRKAPKPAELAPIHPAGCKLRYKLPNF